MRAIVLILVGALILYAAGQYIIVLTLASVYLLFVANQYFREWLDEPYRADIHAGDTKMSQPTYTVETPFGHFVQFRIDLFYARVDTDAFRKSRMLEPAGINSFHQQFYDKVVEPTLRKHNYFFMVDFLSTGMPFGHMWQYDEDGGKQKVEIDLNCLRFGKALLEAAENYGLINGCRFLSWTKRYLVDVDIWDNDVFERNLKTMSADFMEKVRSFENARNLREAEAIVILADLEKIRRRYEEGVHRSPPLTIFYKVLQRGIEFSWQNDMQRSRVHGYTRGEAYRGLCRPTEMPSDVVQFIDSSASEDKMFYTDIKPGQTKDFMFFVRGTEPNTIKVLGLEFEGFKEVSVDKGYIGFTIRMADTETYRMQREIGDKEKIASLKAKEKALSEDKKSTAAFLQDVADEAVANAMIIVALEETVSAIPGIDGEDIVDQVRNAVVRMRDEA